MTWYRKHVHQLRAVLAFLGMAVYQVLSTDADVLATWTPKRWGLAFLVALAPGLLLLMRAGDFTPPATPDLPLTITPPPASGSSSSTPRGFAALWFLLVLLFACLVAFPAFSRAAGMDALADEAGAEAEVVLAAVRRPPCYGQGARRDPAQVRAFKKLHPCPGGVDKGSRARCTGYVVDHVKALECCGADRPSNMQWQTVRAAKAKDKVEGLCR